jgi:murein DD-endopeptidase MepM/ murein hydrolase activator NlpD
MKTSLAVGIVCALAASAAAKPRVTIQPKVVHRGDPLLITVAGERGDDAPKGTAAGAALQFFKTRAGTFQAVVAVPLEMSTDQLTVDVRGADEVVVPVRAKNFAETDIIVEDELANPDAAQRAQIDADNKAIIDAVRNKADPQWSRAFKRPPGSVSSPFGEWRTFNDGHKSQHLGMDTFAREGSPVRAANAGTVTLVRDTFLAGTVIVISHGAGIGTAYYHLSSTDVTEGDVVDRGALIGRAGQTGRATGPHLHISVRTPGGWVDPAGFFKLKIGTPAPSTVAIRRP